MIRILLDKLKTHLYKNEAGNINTTIYPKEGEQSTVPNLAITRDTWKRNGKILDKLKTQFYNRLYT